MELNSFAAGLSRLKLSPDGIMNGRTSAAAKKIARDETTALIILFRIQNSALRI